MLVMQVYAPVLKGKKHLEGASFFIFCLALIPSFTVSGSNLARFKEQVVCTFSPLGSSLFVGK